MPCDTLHIIWHGITSERVLILISIGTHNSIGTHKYAGILYKQDVWRRYLTL